MTIPEIIAEGARLFNLSADDIYGDYRNRYYCRARFALYKALQLRGASGAQVGRWMKRDHSTVRHGIERADFLMESDPAFRHAVEKIAKLGKEEQ